jgi:hydrogenase maturation protein HypF
MENKKIKLPFKVSGAILALGSQSKNTLCFAKGNFAYLSPVHQDLGNLLDFLKFKKNVKYFLKRNPRIIAHDLHPEYASTKYALNLTPHTYHLSPIQHHHAHIASCMIENGLKNQKVIGVAFDGTGLGADNTLWGAEFLVCDYKNFSRRAHLKEIPLVGAEKAILEPVRALAAWLNFSGLKKFQARKWKILKKISLSGFNSPSASSMGRLFDAVASLVLEKNKAAFEAELAINLEKVAKEYRVQSTEYRFKIDKKEGIYIIDPLKMFKQIIFNLRNRVAKEKIAYRFHLTVAEMVRRVCLILRNETHINKIVLSGGVFQNSLLLRLSYDLLYKEGFKVFTHKNLSCNDSSISLGQAAVANSRS